MGASAANFSKIDYSNKAGRRTPCRRLTSYPHENENVRTSIRKVWDVRATRHHFKYVCLLSQNRHFKCLRCDQSVARTTITWSYRVIINEWKKEWYGHRHISTGNTVKRYTIRITNVGHLTWNTKHLYSVHLVLRARAKKIFLVLCSTAPLGAGRGLPLHPPQVVFVSFAAH